MPLLLNYAVLSARHLNLDTSRIRQEIYEKFLSEEVYSKIKKRL
jgi:hypothetical protein